MSERLTELQKRLEQAAYPEEFIHAAQEYIPALEAENVALRAEAGRLREFIEEVAGGDCYQYDKFLNPKPCGTCQSCRARAVLSSAPLSAAAVERQKAMERDRETES